MLFIYQYPDWTHFRFAKSPVLDLLCRVRYVQGKLQGKSFLAVPKSLAESIQRTDFEALLKIDNVENDLPVLYSAARNFSLPMTENRLLSLHASLFQNGGAYRKSSDSQGAFCGVSPERISQEVQKFFAYFNDSPADSVLKASIAHFWFLTIRPFDSGNGILARLLSDQLLSKSENSPLHLYALNAEILEDRETYFEKLHAAQISNGDITEWILYFLSQMESAISKSLGNLQSQFESAKRQFSLGEIALSEREQKLVKHLRQNAEIQISSSEWAAMANISHDSALRDLSHLVAENVLEKSKGKGRSTHYRLSI